MELVALDGGAWIDLDLRVVHRGDARIELTAREAELLGYLAARPGQLVRWEELHREVWRYSPAVVSRAPYFAWRRLVHKIEVDPSRPLNLQSDHGDGVRLRPAPAPPPPPIRRAPPDPFVGRRAELDAVRAALARRSRLLTLTGPPGAGKSRLAAEVAGPDWPILDVSDLEGPSDLDLRLASALGTSPRALAAHLARSAPLVLDGCDLAAEAVAGWLSRWLPQVPELRVLATSRSPLRVEGEQVAPIGPLSRPEAVALFVDRARAADAPFDPEPVRAWIERIVDAVDRLPLAIELAAARVRLLPPSALLARLEDDLRTLGGSSLEASLARSWAVLDPDEQWIFAQLSVFRAAPTEAAVEAVVERPEGMSALDALERLVDRSLAAVEPGEEPRYPLYRVVASFAADRLRERGPSVERAVRDRHARWFARTGATAWREPRSEGSLPDWIAAHRHAGDDALAVDAGLGALATLSRRGSLDEALRWIEALAPRASADRSRRLELFRGRILARAGRYADAERAFLALREAAAEAGDGEIEEIALGNLGAAAVARGDPAEGERLLRAAGSGRAAPPAERLRWLALLSVAVRRQGRWDEARALARDALSLARAGGDPEQIAAARLGLAQIHLYRGDPRAVEEICREMPICAWSWAVHSTHASALAMQDRWEEAQALVDETIASVRASGRWVVLIDLLEFQAVIRLERGDPEGAEAACREGLGLCLEVGHPTAILDGLRTVALARTGREALAREGLARLAVERPYRNLDDAGAAIVRADAALTLGEREQALAALEAARAIGEAHGGVDLGAVMPCWRRVAAALQQSAR